MSIFSRMFGRSDPPPEVKQSSVGALVSAMMLGRPVWNARSFEQLAKEGYQRNVIVYAGIWMTTTAAASIPLCIRKDGGEIELPELEALLNRPNPIEDGAAWRQAILSDFMLGGNAFAERVDVRQRPKELYRWRPDRVAPIPGAQGWPAGFIYKVGSNERRVLIDPTKPDSMPVLHLRDYSPVDDWLGMSPLDPASFAADSYSGAQAWNKALIDNGAAPSGALVYSPKEGSAKLSDEQFQRLKAELERNYSGPRNAGRPMVLDGGMDWKAIGLSPKDMDFVNGKNSAARDVALAIGIPPLMLGIPGDNTFANYAEANKAFYRQSVIPLLWRLCRALNWWIAPSFGPGISIEPDLDDVPAFADEREAHWARIQGTDFLTIDEKRQAVGLKPLPNGVGNVILVPSTMIPLESAGAELAGGAAPGDEGDDGSGGDDEGEAGDVEGSGEADDE